MEHLWEILHSAQKVAEQAEVFWISSQETPVHFEANKLKQVQTKENTSVALRIFKEGKVGLSAVSGPHPSLSLEGEGRNEVGTLLDMAMETSQFGNPANFTFPSLKDYPEVSIFDPQVEKITMEQMIEYGNQLIARVREYASDILCDVEVTKGISSVHVINSQGGEASYAKSFFGFGLEGILIQDTDMLFVGDGESSCCLPDKLEVTADRVIRQLELAKGKATVSTKPLSDFYPSRGSQHFFNSYRCGL